VIGSVVVRASDLQKTTSATSSAILGYFHMIFIYNTIHVPYVDARRHRRGNDFSVEEAKVGEKQSRQSYSKYNFMQYVFFEKKGICSVQWGLR